MPPREKRGERVERERDVELALVGAVEQEGGLCLKFSSPSRRAVPDRLCLLPGGRIFFVECKAPGKVPTRAQSYFHTILRNLGFEVFVVDSVLRAESMVVDRDWETNPPSRQ